MKSFRLSSDEDRFKTHAFVSFKTDPDESLAESVAAYLRADKLDVTYIHGDTECPHPFGSAEAQKWIRELLGMKVNESRILLSIASSASLRSKWVFQEFYSATQTCQVILLLWFNGADPTTHFVPAPRVVTRRLPSCPVYLVDCRSETSQRIDEVATMLHSLPSMKKSLLVRRCFWAVALFAVFVGPLAAILFAMQPSSDQLDNVRHSQMLQTAAEMWLLIISTLAAVFVPASLRLPSALRRKNHISLIVPGFGVQRYVIVLMFLLVLCAGLSMNVWAWLAIGVPSTILVSIANQFLRRRLILQSFKQ